ncbi:GGDEF domain-containing protein [Hydrogenimonas sp. SS33]|uniref:GGDEF domain-containing protein n=1 Tax=Hydrogenimonas leucolamina TaxID=2954236 RepID=UPI00336BC107
MKRFLTLNFVLLFILSLILVTLGYSLHKLKLSFRQNLYERYSENIHSDTTQLRLDLQTLINNSDIANANLLPNLLIRFINIHPATQEVQVTIDKEVVADSSIVKQKNLPTKYSCFSIEKLSGRSIENGIFCYAMELRIYRNGKRVPARLYLLLDRNYLTTEVENQLRKMMMPVYGAMGIVLFISALLIWSIVIRNFSRLIRWSDDPTRKPPHFLIREFIQISEKMYLFARRLIEQFEQIREAMARESYLRSIMETVARINELLVMEKEETRFLTKACGILASHRNYVSASVFLRDKNGEITPESAIVAVNDSVTSDISSLCIPRETLEKLDDPNIDFIIGQADEFNRESPSCVSVRVTKGAKESRIAIFPLRYDASHPPLGYLIINTAEKTGFDREETAMLQELAGDIGFAVNAFRKEEAFEALLYRNPLTHLPNASAFHAKLNDHLGETVAIANIDRFKQINNLYGIQIADEILKQFSAFLAEIVPPKISLYHYIGDEFILLFDPSCEKNRIEEALDKIVKKIESHIFTYRGVEIMLSIRIGVSRLENALSLRECHIALREAKTRHNPIQWYTPDLNILVKQDMLQTYRIVKDALEKGRVINHYQGIFSFEKNDFTHYEALARIEKEDGTMLYPGEFIDFTKQTRLYPRLSAEVVQRALKDIEKLHRSVSVNLSVLDILNDLFCREVYRLLESTPRQCPLVFEILESENIENYDRTSEFIQKVKEYGCKVAIDDFGSGYSNFRHIAELKADMLKIDGSLIKNVVHDEQIRAIVRNINAIAHDLGMTTVAEFVSNEEIYEMCRELGIDAVQGFYRHKPSPIDKIIG